MIVLILSIAKISGTSIGVYYDRFYGKDAHNPSLLLGKPRDVRSDEYLVITQLSILQERNNFKSFNSYQGEGKDVSVVLDVPYLEWSTIFKPQNFAYYILPLENAFAFKWWAMLAFLLIVSYYLFLQVLPIKKYRLNMAILGSMLVSFSPFVFWWYQAGTIMTLGYGFAILLCLIYLIKYYDSDRRLVADAFLKIGSVTIVLAYLLIAFALIFYPPFQIPIILSVGIIAAGYVLNEIGFNIKKLLRLSLPIVGALVMVVAVCFVFYKTRLHVFEAMTGTVYPGNRISESGKDYYSYHLFSTYLQPQLQRDSKGTNYIINQSESSNFIIPSTFLLGTALFFIIKNYRQKKWDWILINTTALSILFTLHLLAPLPLIITRLSLLSFVPPRRLLIGLGFLGVFQLIYLCRYVAKATRDRNYVLFTYIYLATLAVACLFAGYKSRMDYPLFTPHFIAMIALLLWLMVGFGSILMAKFRAGLILVGLFCLFCTVMVNPLYRGLDPVITNRLTDSIRSISPANSVWGTIDGTYVNNFPQLAGRRSLSGIEFYPSQAYWSRYLGESNNYIYNRYAHVALSDNKSVAQLLQNDMFKVSATCEKDIMKDIDFLLSTKPLYQECLRHIETIKYPNVDYFLYKNSSH